MNMLRAMMATAGTLALAGGASELEILRRGSVATRIAPAENFTGTVRLQSQFRRAEPSRLSGALVSFDAGARTHWHSHPLGQTLVVTAGEGLVQRWGGMRERIREGDIVWIPPGVKHWHGAGPSSEMSHVALVEVSKGENVTWMEQVSEQQYRGGS